MIKYLLDTDMVIDIIRSVESVAAQKVREVTTSACAIADLTLFELYCGAAASNNPTVNYNIVNYIKDSFKILSSNDAYIEASIQKIRLKQSGKPIDDFDLLIGCTAKVHNLVAVTGNTKHLSRVEGLEVCCWR